MYICIYVYIHTYIYMYISIFIIHTYGSISSVDLCSRPSEIDVPWCLRVELEVWARWWPRGPI